jgi:type I restriction enzyme S subunit
MIADLEPYARMKDSGVPWLGDVPEHWDVLPNRAVFTEVKERDHPDADMLSVTITKGVIRQRAYLEGSSKKDGSNQDKSAYKLVRPGDIAYNKMRAWQGALGMSEYQGIVSPAYVVQRPRRVADARYMHYLLRTPAFMKEAERWSYGITSDMWSLRPEHFKLIYSCVPPLPEQAAIVRFLNYADRRIRRYIRAKQKLIKLLDEQRQAIIHNAVTRGLDPNARLKPSGVDWLGDVPEHWELTQLRRLTKPETTITYGIVQAGPDLEGGVPYIRTSDMRGKELPESGYLRTSPEIDASYRRSKVSAQDLVVAIRATLGKGLLVPEFLAGANLTQGTARVSPGLRLLPQFLMHVFSSPLCQEQIRLVAKGTTYLEITLEALRRVLVTVPPLDEQEAIVNYIHYHAASDGAADRAGREIALFHEYRTGLIADVVTGKLDVREAASDLPEEPEEPEPFEEREAPLDGDESPIADLDAILEEAEA